MRNNLPSTSAKPRRPSSRWLTIMVSVVMMLAVAVAGLLFGTALSARTTGSDESAAFTRPNRIQTDVAQLGRLIAKHPDKVAIVLISTPGCPYCELVRTRQLKPLFKDHSYDQVSVFELTMRDNTQFAPALNGFATFERKRIDSVRSPADLADQLRIRLAPTVLFIGGGRELSERLIGYGNGDFYASYLEDRIRHALESVNSAGE